jgi:Flp pilus assembly protein TadD
MRAKNPGAAIPALQKLSDVDAHLFEAANALGISLALDGQKDAARRAFSRALESYPSAEGVRRNLAALDGHGCDG